MLTAAQGLRVALRHGGRPPGAGDLRVADGSTVDLPDLPPQVGLTPEGRPWRRVWSLADRLVVEYVDVVTVEVRDDGAVVFDEDLPADVEEHLLLDHVLPLFLARRGAIVLHGAVLRRGDDAVVLCGPTGAGKSTLSAYATQRGWTLGGDDGAVLHFDRAVTVEPTYSTVRLTPESVRLLGLPSDLGREVAGKRRLEAGSMTSLAWEPTRLAMVAHVQPTDEAATFRLLQGAEAHATLFGVTFHADLGPGNLLRSVVDHLAMLAEQVTVGRLSVPRGQDGLAAAEQVLRQVLASEVANGA